MAIMKIFSSVNSINKMDFGWFFIVSQKSKRNNNVFWGNRVIRHYHLLTVNWVVWWRKAQDLNDQQVINSTLTGRCGRTAMPGKLYTPSVRHQAV